MSYVVMVVSFAGLFFIGLPGLQSPNPEERKNSKAVAIISAAMFGIGALLRYLGR